MMAKNKIHASNRKPNLSELKQKQSNFSFLSSKEIV